mgnify:CR=1 FL=1
MIVGIVGLGLIGGSFAKAYHEAGWKVLAHNRSRSVLDFAKISGAVDDELTHENISECDLVLITVYPAAAARYLEAAAPHIGKKPVVIDCCGTKRVVCKACFPLAEKYGFTVKRSHKLRKTFATRLAAQKVELETIRKILGHQDLKTTLGYIFESKDDRSESLIDLATAS